MGSFMRHKRPRHRRRRQRVRFTADQVQAGILAAQQDIAAAKSIEARGRGRLAWGRLTLLLVAIALVAVLASSCTLTPQRVGMVYLGAAICLPAAAALLLAAIASRRARADDRRCGRRPNALPPVPDLYE